MHDRNSLISWLIYLFSGKDSHTWPEGQVSGLGPVIWRRERAKEEGRVGSALNPQGIAEERNHVLVGATVITSPSSMVGCMLAPVARNRTQEPRRRSSSAVRSGKMAGESGGILNSVVSQKK